MIWVYRTLETMILEKARWIKEGYTVREVGVRGEGELSGPALDVTGGPNVGVDKATSDRWGKLPTGAAERKQVPIATGVVDYFPDALAAVAEVSRIGNEQHHPGTPLHWDRSKSTDESDALMRHFIERGSIDTDGVRHSAKVAWRALALLQKEIEEDREPQPYGPNRTITVRNPGMETSTLSSDTDAGEPVRGVPPGPIFPRN